MWKTGATLLTLASIASTVHCDPALGVGDPCVPEQEGDATFAGFSEKEVNVESKSLQCKTNLCLVNHFRGRTDLPHGAETADLCVDAQCADRTVDDAVYCSCRCANAKGETDDGSVYCTCPEDGFACTQLVADIGGANQGLTGAYCMKKGTAYDAATSCLSTLAPEKAACPQR
jgi:hypothetical protein